MPGPAPSDGTDIKALKDFDTHALLIGEDKHGRGTSTHHNAEQFGEAAGGAVVKDVTGVVGAIPAIAVRLAAGMTTLNLQAPG